MVSSVVNDGYNRHIKNRYYKIFGWQCLEWLLVVVVCYLNYKSLINLINNPADSWLYVYIIKHFSYQYK